MSHEKIFTQFPATGKTMLSSYYMLDINAIECISQTETREVAVIVTAARTYQVEVDTAALDEGNFPDAAMYCYQIMGNAAINAAAAEREFQQQVDETITTVPVGVPVQ